VVDPVVSGASPPSLDYLAGADPGAGAPPDTLTFKVLPSKSVSFSDKAFFASEALANSTKQHPLLLPLLIKILMLVIFPY